MKRSQPETVTVTEVDGTVFYYYFMIELKIRPFQNFNIYA